MPATYTVYLVRSNLSIVDPDMPAPRYHTAIFVETQPDGSGVLHEVNGDITSSEGMRYESKFQTNPEDSSTFYSKEALGVTDAARYPKSFDNVLHQIPPPPQQKAFNSRTNRTEPFKSKDPLTFYEIGEHRKPLFKCTEWVLDQALPNLRSAGLIKPMQDY